MGGKWAPGQSGGGAGMTNEEKAVREKVKVLARQHTEAAIQSLLEIATDKKAEKRARVAAAIALLDRGYGKPSQAAPEGGGIVGGKLILDFVGRERDNGTSKSEEEK